MEELKPGQPSRFHKYSQKYSKENVLDGWEWTLDCQHPDLVSTAHVKFGHHEYCAYCAGRCREIQADYGRWHRDFPHEISVCAPSWAYYITGYTCDCDGARAEREEMDAIKVFEKKVAIGRKKLAAKFEKRRTYDIKNLLRLKHRLEAKEIENRPDGYIPSTTLFTIIQPMKEKHGKS